MPSPWVPEGMPVAVAGVGAWDRVLPCGEGRLEEVYVIHWGHIWGQRDTGDCSRCSATELGMTLVALTRRNRAGGEDLQLALPASLAGVDCSSFCFTL